MVSKEANLRCSTDRFVVKNRSKDEPQEDPMDLDSFQKDYQDFKSRVAPMLAEYEAAVKRMVGIPVSEEETAAAADLHAAIHAPLPANSTMLPIAEGDAAIAAASTAMAPKPVPGPAP